MPTYYDYEPQSLDAQLAQDNIAESIPEQRRIKLAHELYEIIEDDNTSRMGWLEQNRDWLKMAMQALEKKNFPWPDASNVKFPLITMSAIQFHARASQALLKGYDLVRVRLPGMMSSPDVKQRSERVSRYMSYQLTTEMKEWSEDTDRLLFVLPILGLAFKKTYYSPSKRRNVSELVLPQNLIVNYYAQSFEEARKTHVMYLPKNEMVSRMREGTYIDSELHTPTIPEIESVQDDIHKTAPSTSLQDYPYTIYESHCNLDLDEDGYEEPYIVTLDASAKQILRITPRFSPDNVVRNKKKQIARIDPEHHFTRYVFIPDPESSIYGLGLGNLLGPSNHAVNTILNQLIDAGTLSNLQGGLLGRGMRIRGGALRLKPGEWQWVPTTGDDIRKNVFPMPIREPSSVLFQLLGFLVDAAQKTGSVTEAMTGEMPGQNTPFSTTQRMLEEGLMVFTGIYKRIYRALGNEYYKLFKLNHYYLTDEQYLNILDTQEMGATTQVDFNLQDVNVVPSADPDMISEIKKLMRSETLLQKVQMGLPINVQVATKRNLEAEGHEDVDELMQVPPPQPNFELEFQMQQHQDTIQLQMAELQLKAETQKFEYLKDFAQAISLLQKAENLKEEQVSSATNVLNENMQKVQELELKAMDIISKHEVGMRKSEQKPQRPTNGTS